MDSIVSEFVNLMKGCSNGLALEKEVWQRGIQIQCQALASTKDALPITVQAAVLWSTWLQRWADGRHG
ncbi:hypothetical protein [Acidaminococcus sp.]|uniref:hypothetical protein n=1 Tax=Acidaminococcus sp. TaxID=1872103 RepID=UPI003D7C86E9